MTHTRLFLILGFVLSLFLPFTSKSQTGAALKFDGVDDYVSLPTNIASTFTNGQAMTIEYWFKGTNIQSAVRLQSYLTGGYIVSGWNGQHIISTDGGTAGISMGNLATITDGNWHHIAVVWEKNRTNGFRSYLDGNLVEQRNSSNFFLPDLSGANTVNLGCYFTSATTRDEFMNGTLDEVRFWNVALNSCSIKLNFMCELPMPQSNLLAYYKFNQGLSSGSNTSITTLNDATSNAYHGTLNNFSLLGFPSNWTSPGAVTTNVSCTSAGKGLVSIAASSQTIGIGTSVTFTATPTFVGSPPQYQWRKNGINVGTNAATYTDNVLVNGDVIDVLMTDNCFDNTPSNSITMTVAQGNCGFSTLYVDANVATSGNGRTWATAFKTLSEALEYAWLCTSVYTINVAKGTYKPDNKPFNTNGTQIVTSDNRDRTFHIRNTLTVLGGFPNGGGTRDPINNETILSGDFNGDDAMTDIGNGGIELTGVTDNAYHVLLCLTSNAQNPSTVDGFTIVGGGANNGSSITVNSVVVYRNQGGGIYDQSTNITLNNLIVKRNDGDYGGGAYLAGDAFCDYTNSVFYQNTAFQGGGMYVAGGTIKSNVIAANTSTTAGGGVYLERANQFNNNTIVKNRISSNLSGSYGGGFYQSGTTLSSLIYNCIVWGNTTAITNDTGLEDFFTSASSQTQIFNCTIGGGQFGITNRSNILSTNPKFVNLDDLDGADDKWRTADDGLKLQLVSTALNSGSNTNLSSSELEITGALRIQNSTVDRGAYEGAVISCPSATTLYVDGSISASGNGTTWATAYKTLNEALQIAAACPSVTTINMAAGTYRPSQKPYSTSGEEISTNDNRHKTFHLRDGLAIYGGFPAGGGTRNVRANVTILSGDLSENDAANFANMSDNAYHVVLSVSDNNTTLVDGLTITSGNSNGGLSTTVETKTISDDRGAGIRAFGSNLTVNNVIFKNNNGFNASVMYASDNAALTVTDCSVTDNNALNTGAGFYFAAASLAVSRTVFSGNTANQGSAITGTGGMFMMDNCVVTANTSALSGNVDLQFNDNNTLRNSTFYGNTVTSTSATGAALVVGNTINTAIRNCIFWGNTSPNNPSDDLTEQVYKPSNVQPLTIYNSIIQGATGSPLAIPNVTLNNCSNFDPLFSNTADLDGADNMWATTDDGLTILACSAAINTGNNTGVSATDITGASRTQQTTVDMGAYESAFTTPTIPTPSVSIAITTGNRVIPAGTTVTFTATPTNGGTTPQYQWQKNGSNVGSNQNTYTDAALLRNDVIRCIVSSNATCAYPLTATSNTITMDVGATVTWTGAISANWQTAGNWSSNSVPITYDEVIIPATANKPTLSLDCTINSLTFTGANKILLGNYFLSVNGAIDGTSATAYLVCNGSGGLIRRSIPNNALTVFPIGSSESSYDPLSIQPTNSVDFTAKVKETLAANDFTGTIANFDNVFPRQWDISPTGNAGSTVLKLTVGTATLAPPSPRVGHYITGQNKWEELTATYTSRTWTTTTTSFSPFGVGNAGGFVAIALPVELLSFSGKNIEGGNLLTWATAEEKNTRDFEVERSTNGRDFEKIGTVKAKGSNSNYEFTDQTFRRFETFGRLYYRLTINDLDDKKDFSKIISIEKTDKKRVKIYPSVTSGVLTVENAKSFAIINSVGQIVVQETRSAGNFQSFPNLTQLPSGIYIIKGVDTEGGIFAQKIIKN